MKKGILIVIIFMVIVPMLFLYTWRISKSRTFQFFGNLENRIETQEKVVALTFDDGPTEKTDEILKILDELNVKATFFVTGQELEKNLEAGKKIVTQGHELGNHSYSHKQMVLKSFGFIKKELEKTDQLIREAGYKGEIYFRPPYGKKLVLLPYYLLTVKKKTIIWDIEPETYPDVARSSSEIVKHVQKKIKPGSIILLHVMYDSRIESAKAIKGVVNSLRDSGYSFKTVSELFEYKTNN